MTKIKLAKIIKEKMELIIKISLSFLFVIIFCLIFFLGGGLLYFKDVKFVSDALNNSFQMHVINVGQGDCLLLKTPNNRTFLIDTGKEKSKDISLEYINQFLKKSSITSIDYLILTHTDEDHIGGAVNILNNVSVGTIFRPKIYSLYEKQENICHKNYKISNSDIYNQVIQTAYLLNCEMLFSESGIILNEGGCKFEFLSPIHDNYANDNDYSVVIKLTYQNKSILFMGDAEENIENELIRTYGDKLKTDILKVGHHGSKTSTTQDFLDLVDPKYAVICVGNNNLSLPNSEVVNRLNDKNIKILSTMEYDNYAICINENQVDIYFEDKPICDMALILSIFIIILLFIWAFKIPKLKKE